MISCIPYVTKCGTSIIMCMRIFLNRIPQATPYILLVAPCVPSSHPPCAQLPTARWQRGTRRGPHNTHRRAIVRLPKAPAIRQHHPHTCRVPILPRIAHHHVLQYTIERVQGTLQQYCFGRSVLEGGEAHLLELLHDYVVGVGACDVERELGWGYRNSRFAILNSW